MIPHALLAEMCATTYQDGHSDHVFPAVGEVEAAGRVMGNTLIIAFRGTEVTANRHQWYSNLRDVVRDLRFFPWKSPYGWVHAGFYKGAKAWAEEHDASLKALFPGVSNLCITGHSLGAALAVQYTMLTRHEVSQVTLFGEPRGLFESSQRHYRESGYAKVTTSYREGKDLVTFIPPWGRSSVPYTQIGQRNMYDHDIGQYVEGVRQ